MRFASANQTMIVGIDASRNRSGGAKVHLHGLLTTADPKQYGIECVHLWSHRRLLDQIPAQPWMTKHAPAALDSSLSRQVWWQTTKLSQEAAAVGCDILFTTDASTTCRFKPMVTLSQDLLSYEPGVMRLFGISRARLRLLTILWLQNRALRSSAGAMFLTRYAASVIQKSCGGLSNVACVPHGVGDEFRRNPDPPGWPNDAREEIRCVYVSNAAMYKHQWEVVRAIASLRRRGHNLALELIGGGSGRAQARLDAAIAECDPDGAFVTQSGKIPHAALPAALRQAHLFIFASSCENLPVTLLEGMATGLPIACSNRGPMPEVLQDAGVYFDPEDYGSIAQAIEKLVVDTDLRNRVARQACILSRNYSWSRCATETWKFISLTYNRYIADESGI